MKPQKVSVQPKHRSVNNTSPQRRAEIRQVFIANFFRQSEIINDRYFAVSLGVCSTNISKGFTSAIITTAEQYFYKPGIARQKSAPGRVLLV